MNLGAVVGGATLRIAGTIGYPHLIGYTINSFSGIDLENMKEIVFRKRDSMEDVQKITIDKFRNLVPQDSPDRNQLYGAIAMETKRHEKMCENLKVGDRVFFFMIMPKLDDPDVSAEMSFVAADVIE